MSFGKVDVAYGHLPDAHTDGDLYAFFPDRNVLVVGDLLSVGRYPVIDYTTGGCLAGMARAAADLSNIADADTKIVPALGPVQRRADLLRYRDMCAALTARIGAMVNEGLSFEQVVAARPTRDYDADWGDPELFLTQAYKSLVARRDAPNRRS